MSVNAASLNLSIKAYDTGRRESSSSDEKRSPRTVISSETDQKTKAQFQQVIDQLNHVVARKEHYKGKVEKLSSANKTLKADNKALKEMVQQLLEMAGHAGDKAEAMHKGLLETKDLLQATQMKLRAAETVIKNRSLEDKYTNVYNNLYNQ